MSEEIKVRVDPTLLLPEEPMDYEYKKKKKKKRKRHAEDPFKDIEEISHAAAPVQMTTDFDPEVIIKVEDIDVDLNFEQLENTQAMSLPSEDPEIALDDQKKQALLLTIQNVMGNHSIFDYLPPEGEQSEIHTCSLCHMVFKNGRNLILHQRRKHNVNKKGFIYTCDDCGMTYDKKCSLITHRKRKHDPNSQPEDEEPRACDICSLVFKGMMRLRMHMRRKHDSFTESFKFKCRDCGLTYDKRRSLLVHRKRKHTKSGVRRPQWFNCPECSKIFDKKETYVRHLQRKHLAKKDMKIPKEFLENLKEINTSGEIPCKQCPLVFSSLTYLKLHMRRKHNAYKEDFSLKCTICGLSYDKYESLKRHVTRKHGDGMSCKSCNKVFENKEEFQNHKHEKPVLECTICGLIFATQGTLGKHIRCTHKINVDGQVTVTCQLCGAGFHKNRQYKVHLQKVHSNITYPCKYCKKNFKCKESFRRHCFKFHSAQYTKDQNEYECVMCPAEAFPNEFDLCRHIDGTHTVLIKEEGAIKKETTIKKETVKDEEAIKNEVTEQKEAAETKENEQVYRCTKCSEVSSNWSDIKKHYVKYHHVVEEIQCQQCGDLLPENELAKHVKLVHPVVTDYNCSYCDFHTTSKVSLTQHILRHKNAKTLNCEYPGCRYKSYYDEAMEKHRKKHAELGKKLQCAYCSFQTMNKYILRYHEEVHKTGKKKYTCDECDYSTILPANLVQHKYKHSTVKKFKCEYCPFATKYNTSLRFHVKKKHCDLPFPAIK